MSDGPHLRILGTAQDGGVPHAGCDCGTCTAALADPSARRRVSCAAIIGVGGRTLVVDATPDWTRQVAALASALGRPPPAVDEILLTHAHMGHYAGLLHLGREAMDARRMPVRCTERMATFLRENRPWSHLVTRAQIELLPVRADETFSFDGLSITPFASPHRAEDTDTLGLEIRGGDRRIVLVTDADRFTPDLVERIRAADVALVDGTFYHRRELPRRAILEVAHPFVEESVPLLAGARGEVHFTHLNHTNALLHPDPAKRPVLPPGFSVLEDGAVFPL
ncbi:MAG: MBL fold metallo-hydrolase [Planctomycetota bacterium]|jgi:pyrroloquinoline quinone biosynthesis protein B